MKLISIAALAIALAIPAFAEDAAKPAGPVAPRTAMKQDAVKAATPSGQQVVTTTAPATATTPAVKAAETPKADTGKTADTKPMGVGAPKPAAAATTPSATAAPALVEPKKQ